MKKDENEGVNTDTSKRSKHVYKIDYLLTKKD